MMENQTSNTDYQFIRAINDELHDMLTELVETYYDGSTSNMQSMSVREAYSMLLSIKQTLYNKEYEVWEEIRSEAQKRH